MAGRVKGGSCADSVRRCLPARVFVHDRENATGFNDSNENTWISIIDPTSGKSWERAAGLGHASIDGWGHYGACQPTGCDETWAVIVRWLTPRPAPRSRRASERRSTSQRRDIPDQTRTPPPLILDELSVTPVQTLDFDGAPATSSAGDGGFFRSTPSWPGETHRWTLHVPAALLTEPAPYPRLGRVLIAENVTEWSGAPAAFSTHLAVGDSTSDATGGPIALELDWLSGCRVGVDCEVPITVTFGWNAVEFEAGRLRSGDGRRLVPRGDPRGLHSGCDDPARPPAGEASRRVVAMPNSRVLCSATHRAGRDPQRGQGGPGPPMSARPAHITAGQLALELPAELPALALAPEWKDQQRLWGHTFHPMCSYLASFPAALTHAFIARYSRPGDVVLDPFSGRGTTPLQACAEGRIGVGNDLNPFAHLLTAAKVEPATRAQAATRLAQLRLAWNANSAGWLALGERVWTAPEAADVARAGRRVGRDALPTARSASRPRSPWPSTRGRSASCCSSGRPSASTTGPTGSWPPR